MPDSTPSPEKHEAFVRALTDLQFRLRGYCQASLGHGDEANEAVQRTNITLWKKIDEWDESRDFGKWAISVAKFEVLGVIRDRKRTNERFVFDADVAEKMASVAETSAPADSSRKLALESCLPKVSDANQEMLTSYFVDGETYAEIAQRTGKGLSAVKVAMLRLRRILRECIERNLAEEGRA